MLDQHARFRLLQPPALGLLASAMVSQSEHWRCRRGCMPEGYAQRGDLARVYGVRRLDQSEFIGAHLQRASLASHGIREALSQPRSRRTQSKRPTSLSIGQVKAAPAAGRTP